MPTERRQPDGHTWAELHARLTQIVEPLVDAGWAIVDQFDDPSEDDCVVCELRRGDASVSIDHYPDGWTHVSDQIEAHDPDIEPEALIATPPGSDRSDYEAEFRSSGLL